jgi:hypothetical protein
MGLLLILLGIIIWLFVSSIVGIILIIIGLVLLFVPGVPGGYHSYRGRGAP